MDAGAANRWVAGILVSPIVGGWISCRLSGATRSSEGAMEGMLT